MKTIAIVVSEMDTGGVSEALIEMLRHFDYSRYRVTVWVALGKGAEHGRLDSRVQVRYWGEEDPAKALIGQLKSGHLIQFCRSVFFRLLGRLYINTNDKHAYYCVRSLPNIDAEVYDYVICYQGVSPLVIPNALHRIRGKEKILWIHGDLGREDRLMPFCRKHYHRFVRAIAVSAAARDLFVQQYNYPAERTAVFHNLVDRQQILQQARQPLGHPMDHPAIVTVGRLSPEKGQIMIPAAMKLLLDAGCDARWYLIGDGATKTQLQAEISRLELEDRVVLLGRQENPFPYMMAADVYVQTSFSEGWCLTVQEARILGKPVISTPLPAVMEQISSGENGLICRDMSSEALSEAIALLLKDAALRQRLADSPGGASSDPAAEMERLYHILENQNGEALL